MLKSTGQLKDNQQYFLDFTATVAQQVEQLIRNKRARKSDINQQ